MVKRPFDLLNSSVGKKVLVGMKGNREALGKMLAFDIHMNIVLEDAELKEVENGEVKVKNMKSIFIRGDSLVYLSPIEEES